MHDLYSFLNRKPSHLKLREYVKTKNTTCSNIAKVYVDRISFDSQYLSFTSGEISYLTVESRPFRFVGPVSLLGFANLDRASA